MLGVFRRFDNRVELNLDQYEDSWSEDRDFDRANRSRRN